MSDEIEYDAEGNEFVRLPADQAKNQREIARQAEANAKAAEDAKAEAAAAQRELAFFRAGINADSDVGKMFVKGYDGELTAEAIKEAAAKIPTLLDATAEPVTEQTPEQIEAARLQAEQTGERSDLARGAASYSEAEARDPRELAREAVAKARIDGLSEENALSAGLNELVGAAMAGDKRVRLPSFGDRGQ